MTRDEKTNTNTEKKALYRLEMRKEAPVIILTSFARSLTARNGDKFSCVLVFVLSRMINDPLCTKASFQKPRKHEQK